MSAWKVLFILLFGMTCLALAFSTLVVPMTLAAEEGRWQWFAGLLGGTIVMGTLFAMFLKHSDRTFRI